MIDLNLAYHPSCTYDPRWCCPLAPEGNRMTAPVAAGEQLPPGGWYLDPAAHGRSAYSAKIGSVHSASAEGDLALLEGLVGRSSQVEVLDAREVKP